MLHECCRPPQVIHVPTAASRCVRRTTVVSLPTCAPRFWHHSVVCGACEACEANALRHIRMRDISDLSFIRFLPRATPLYIWRSTSAPFKSCPRGGLFSPYKEKRASLYCTFPTEIFVTYLHAAQGVLAQQVLVHDMQGGIPEHFARRTHTHGY